MQHALHFLIGIFLVIFLQLLIFALAVAIRGRFLFGKQLKKSANSSDLSYIRVGKHGSVRARHVGISREAGIPFIIKRERWYHTVLKAMGIAAEINVGNDTFDTKFFIATDHPSHLERALAASAMIADLQALFALPIKSVHATKTKLWCICKRSDLAESESYYARHRELLRDISKRTLESPNDLGEPHAPRRRLGMIALFFLAAHAGVLTLGLVGAFPTYVDSIETFNASSLIATGLFFGAIMAGVWLFLILAVFVRSSWVCWVLMDFIICGIAGFMFSGVHIAREANTHLSQPAPRMFIAPIIQKTCTLECTQSCGKRCTRRSSYRFETDAECTPQARIATMARKKQEDSICRSKANYDYEITTTGWQTDKNYSFSPEPALFDRVSMGTPLAIAINPGALGAQWVDSDAIRPASE